MKTPKPKVRKRRTPKVAQPPTPATPPRFTGDALTAGRGSWLSPGSLVGLEVEYSNSVGCYNGVITAADRRHFTIRREDDDKDDGKLEAVLAEDVHISAEDLFERFLGAGVPPVHTAAMGKSVADHCTAIAPNGRAVLRPGMLVYDNLAEESGVIVWMCENLIVYETYDGRHLGQAPGNLVAAVAGGFIDKMVPVNAKEVSDA